MRRAPARGASEPHPSALQSAGGLFCYKRRVRITTLEVYLMMMIGNAAGKPAAEKKADAGKGDTCSSGEAHPLAAPWQQRWRRRGWCFAGVLAFLIFDCSSPGEPPADVDLACHHLVFRPCDSFDIPTDVVSACQDLFLRRVAFSDRCTGSSAPPSSAEEQAFVDTCAGIATAPGVALTHLDIKDCADQMDTSGCLGGGVFPSCVGHGAELLFPEHDRKGTFTPGEMCFANVQCDSGYCDHNAFDACGVCKRARMDGETCGGATDLCVEGECRDWTCQPSGKKVGEECTNHGIECQPALYCGGSKCVPYGQLGASCDASTYCADGLRCQAGVCV